MKREVFTHNGKSLLQVEEAEPECGKDFCDECMDCLHCDGDTPCYSARDGEHRWVVYEKKVSQVEEKENTKSPS